MRVVSDFLDRVAARVIGGDAAMLTPRIPSMYEPSPSATNAPLEQSLSVAAAPASPIDDDVAAPSRPKRFDKPAAQARAEAAHDDIGSERTEAASTKRDQVGQPTVIHTKEVVQHHSDQHVLVDSHARRSVPESHGETSSREREGRSPSISRAATIPDHAVGVLLPPEQPVFGASTASATRRASPERGHVATVQAQSESHEPVVHVSIGRIEVRASSQASATPRRQDAVRVDRLGDYLRERNKASP